MSPNTYPCRTLPAHRQLHSSHAKYNVRRYGGRVWLYAGEHIREGTNTMKRRFESSAVIGGTCSQSKGLRCPVQVGPFRVECLSFVVSIKHALMLKRASCSPCDCIIQQALSNSEKHLSKRPSLSYKPQPRSPNCMSIQWHFIVRVAGFASSEPVVLGISRQFSQLPPYTS